MRSGAVRAVGDSAIEYLSRLESSDSWDVSDPTSCSRPSDTDREMIRATSSSVIARCIRISVTHQDPL